MSIWQALKWHKPTSTNDVKVFIYIYIFEFENLFLRMGTDIYICMKFPNAIQRRLKTYSINTHYSPRYILISSFAVSLSIGAHPRRNYLLSKLLIITKRICNTIFAALGTQIATEQISTSATLRVRTGFIFVTILHVCSFP